MRDQHLFDPAPYETDTFVLGPSTDRDSYTRRLTRRRRAMLAAGVHPATRRPLLGGNGTCGTCAHCFADDHHSRRYYKCELVMPTHGPGTDLRLKWPACDAYVVNPHS